VVSVRTGDEEVQIMEAAVLMRSLKRGAIVEKTGAAIEPKETGTSTRP